MCVHGTSCWVPVAGLGPRVTGDCESVVVPAGGPSVGECVSTSEAKLVGKSPWVGEVAWGPGMSGCLQG